MVLNGKNLPYQNFSSTQSMIFSKTTTRATFIPKIRKIHSGVWKLKAKNLQTVNFGQKMAKFWRSQIFPGIYTMILSKKTTRVFSIPKIKKIYSSIWKIQAKNTQKWLFWGSKNFSTKNFFDGHLRRMETQLHAKNPKEISNGQGCRTGTHG